jgi:hypothetical protein
MVRKRQTTVETTLEAASKTHKSLNLGEKIIDIGNFGERAKSRKTFSN